MKEKVLVREKKSEVVYELGGDYFFCFFPLDHPLLRKLIPDTDEFNEKVLALGRKKAKEYKIY